MPTHLQVPPTHHPTTCKNYGMGSNVWVTMKPYVDEADSKVWTQARRRGRGGGQYLPGVVAAVSYLPGVAAAVSYLPRAAAEVWYLRGVAAAEVLYL